MTATVAKPEIAKLGVARSRTGAGEEGFVLLAVLFMLVLVLLSLSIAAPTVATDLRRDKDLEAVNRGKQYTRAIRLYYRKFGSYPNTIDQLMNTNGQRFLRKRYLDPFTGKDDWRLIHVGEAHLSSTGFFGQPSTQPGSPIGGSPAGSTPSGSTSAPPTTIFGSPASSGSSGTSGFGGTSGTSGASPTGSQGSSIFGSSGSSGSSGASPFGSSSGGISGGTPPTGTGATGASAFGTPGATFGGAPIVGVGLPSPKTSILAYRKQTRYNLWEFVYDPNQELAAAAGLGAGPGISQTGASSGAPTTSGPGGTSTSPNTGPGGGNGFGSSGGFGSGSGFGGASPGTGTTPTSPTSPTNPNGNSF